MTYFYIDLIAVGIIILAGLVGMFKGFFATLLSLLGFVGTFVLAYFFSGPMLALLDKCFGLATFFVNTFGESIGRVVGIIVSMIITYLLIRVLVFLINNTIGKVFKGELLGKLNSILGLFFGFAKGALFVAIALVLINIATLIPDVKTWANQTFSQTIFIGSVYNMIGDAIGNFFGNNEVPEGEPEGEPETDPEAEPV